MSSSRALLFAFLPCRALLRGSTLQKGGCVSRRLHGAAEKCSWLRSPSRAALTAALFCSSSGSMHTRTLKRPSFVDQRRRQRHTHFRFTVGAAKSSCRGLSSTLPTPPHGQRLLYFITTSSELGATPKRTLACATHCASCRSVANSCPTCRARASDGFRGYLQEVLSASVALASLAVTVATSSPAAKAGFPLRLRKARSTYAAAHAVSPPVADRITQATLTVHGFRFADLGCVARFLCFAKRRSSRVTRACSAASAASRSRRAGSCVASTSAAMPAHASASPPETNAASKKNSGGFRIAAELWTAAQHAARGMLSLVTLPSCTQSRRAQAQKAR